VNNENIKRAFVSHITEEAPVAFRIKGALTQDFLGLLDVFVSSDTEGIGAGEDWLGAVDQALRESSVVLILCSPASIRRPWINFEAGAAWMRDVPIIPVCHGGLTPGDLPMPLSLRQGMTLTEAEGLRRLYRRIADVLALSVTPERSYEALEAELARLSQATRDEDRDRLSDSELERDRAAKIRLREALSHPAYRWRSLQRLAAAAGVSEEMAADLLRADDEVRFSRGRGGNIIAGLRSRVGQG
jgi:TIR domain